MSAAPNLRVVNSDTGEVEPNSLVARLRAEIDRLKTDLKMAKRDVTAKNRRIAEFERSKVRERLDYERYEDVQRIATYWHRKCRGGNSRVNPMAPARFDAVRGILDQTRIVVDEDTGRKRHEPFYSMEDCRDAVDGAAFDHFSKQRKNGTWEHFDDLELIFRDSKQFENFRDRAPRLAVSPAARDNQ
jgi:hypothetical protein